MGGCRARSPTLSTPRSDGLREEREAWESVTKPLLCPDRRGIGSGGPGRLSSRSAVGMVASHVVLAPAALSAPAGDPPGGGTTTFFFGNGCGASFMGDSEYDGVDTPGPYQRCDGFVHLRNSNTSDSRRCLACAEPTPSINAERTNPGAEYRLHEAWEEISWRVGGVDGQVAR